MLKPFPHIHNTLLVKGGYKEKRKALYLNGENMDEVITKEQTQHILNQTEVKI